eukprot:CAMPEP_0198133098 /NCGR_PEP_ID=MMETSP1442-20131203/59387_1 /TAXON_ID= /ORGANISM="Craspedostauros australis, Strain CCMP3328" /LENGTH=515 /DNA_ID=CAMNT_0043794203 /DNA_START=335 /DNA_END=1882 /DNA_ORIENTATION=-
MPSPTSVVANRGEHHRVAPLKLSEQPSQLHNHNHHSHQQHQQHHRSQATNHNYYYTQQQVFQGLHSQQHGSQAQETGWECPASEKSKRTINPVRPIIDSILKDIKMGYQRADGKDPISLAQCDPAASSALKPCNAALDAVARALRERHHSASYLNASGSPEARVAVAHHHSYHEHIIGADNIVIANGCSGALQLALDTLLDPGTTVLVPHPGFPLYQMIAESNGAKVIEYHLLQDRNWECDMDHLESIMASSTNVRAIIINNPSNPTGAVFSEYHLKQIVSFAAKHHLPIVSDEIYGEITFAPHKFHPMALVAAKMGRQVPVITASGISKQFLVPGWRVGWLAFHDNNYNSLQGIQDGVKRLALDTLLDPGTTVLVPHPGFPLYQMIAESNGAKVIEYHLLQDRNWECDMDHLESIMASSTNVRAIIINNPSNPTGAVFSEYHLKQIVSFAAKHHLPIVSDEIYGEITFAPHKFHPMALVAAKMGRQVPVITASGISKQFLVPGWRVGWLAFHDK